MLSLVRKHLLKHIAYFTICHKSSGDAVKARLQSVVATLAVQHQHKARYSARDASSLFTEPRAYSSPRTMLHNHCVVYQRTSVPLKLRNSPGTTTPAEMLDESSGSYLIKYR